MAIVKKSVTGNFYQSTVNFLKHGEGFSGNIYLDTAMVPTMGFGFALAFGTVGSRSVRSDLDDALEHADITMTSSEKSFLDNLISQINSIYNDAMSATPPLTPNYETAIQALSTANSTGDLTGFSVSETEADLLIDYALAENLETVRGVHASFEAIESSLAGSEELIALYSLAYNSPELIGNGLIDAINDGDRARAWFEILYHHGDYATSGLMNRRESEADLFGLVNSGATAEAALIELNTLYNGTAHNSDNIYDTIQARDEHKPFNSKILEVKTYVQEAFTGGKDVDYIQFADGTWITTGGTINAKAANGITDGSTSNLIVGGSGTDTINGDGGDDYLYGRGGVDTLNGGDGDDTLHGGAGNDTLNGGDGSNTADYSMAASGVTVDLSANEASNDGDGGEDTFTNIQNVRGSFYADTLTGSAGNDIFYGSTGNDTIEGVDGNDIADYSGLTQGISVSSSSSFYEASVSKGSSGSLGTDTLTWISTLIGTKYNDVFAGTQLNGYDGDITVNGGEGFDRYTFNLATDIGQVFIQDNAVSGIDTIEVTNFNSTTMRVKFGHANDTSDQFTITFHQWDTVEQQLGGPILSLTLDKSDILSSTGVDFISIPAINSKPFRLMDIVSYADDGHPGFLNTQLVNIHTEGWNGQTGAAGSVLPVILGGEITEMQYSPSLNHNWVPYAYGVEIMHPSVVTAFATGGGSTYIETKTYAKEIAFHPGIGVDDIRLTTSGSQGSLSLVINVDALGQSFTIPDFEAGKQLNGLAVFNTDIFDYVQSASGVTLSALGGGHYSGNITNSGTAPTVSGSISVTYFLEEISFFNGVIDTLDTITFEGTGTSDVLKGLNNRGDIIYSYAGNDSIYAYGGNDTLHGGTGDDNLYGGTGNDTYTLSYGFGADLISESVNEGTDVIRMTGLAATDIRLWTDSYGHLHLQNKNNLTDHLVVQAAKTSTGGSNQSLIADYVESVVFDDTTTWNLTGGLTIEGSSSAEVLYGTTYNDTLYGLDGSDSLYGNTGYDTLYGGTGDDNLYGGIGNDTYMLGYGFGADLIGESVGEGTDTIRLTGVTAADIRLWTDSYGHLHLQNKNNLTDHLVVQAAKTSTGGSNQSLIADYVESVVFDDSTTWNLTGALTIEGSSSAEVLYGTTYNDTLYGLDGSDSLYGNTGNDTLYGGTGDDNLYGGIGNDTYMLGYGFGADLIGESVGEGTDTIRLTGVTAADIRLWTDTSGHLHLQNKNNLTDHLVVQAAKTSTGGSNQSLIADYVESVVFDDSTTWNLTGALTIEGSSSAEVLYGTTYNDTLYGLDGSDSLYGNTGNDTLYGGTGDDNLYGGIGNDTYMLGYGFGADSINESTSAGTDIIRLTGVNAADIRLWTDTSGHLHLQNKNNLADHVTVQAAFTSSGGTKQSLIGQYMESIVFDDSTTWNLTDGLLIEGSSSADTLYGTTYNDTISGLDDTDTIYGNSGNDILYGGTGSDNLNGGDGNDLLYGGAGTDSMTGGAGADKFVFEIASAFSEVDIIADFSTAQGDSIDLVSLLGSYDPLTELITDFVEMTTSGSNTILKVDQDGTGSTYGWTQIATIQSVTGLTDEAALVSNGNLVVA